jgi:hypothetical protein
MKYLSPIRSIAWLLLLSLPAWLGACGNKGDSVSPSSVQGSWRISSYTIDPAFDLTGTGKKTNDAFELYKAVAGQQAVDCIKTVTITFKSDGTMGGSASTAAACRDFVGDFTPTSAATWKVTGNKLQITDSGTTQEYDIALSGSELKMSQKETDDLDGDGKEETITLTLGLTKV